MCAVKLTVVAKLLGLTLGVVLVYARFDRRYFDIHALFLPESPWNLSLWQFLEEGRRVGLRILIAPADAWIGNPR